MLRAWLKSLANGMFRRPRSRKARSVRPASARPRLAVEALEERVVLFGGLYVQAGVSGSVLQITASSGDPTNHLVRLQQDTANPSTQTDVVDNGTAVGTFNNSAFTQIGVTLGSGNDTVNLSNVLSPSSGIVIDGGGGTNTLLGWYSTVTTWSVSGANSGSSSSVTFHNVENLTSASGEDYVYVLPGGSLAGTFDGGAISQLDYSRYNTGVTVNLQTGSATAFGAVANVNSLVGSPYNDTLTASNYNGANSINADGGSDTINGGSIGTDSILLDNQASTTVVNGGGAPTTLSSEGVWQNIYTVTGANSGNVNGASFNHVGNLSPLNSSDVVRIQSGGSLSGSISGCSSTLDYSGYNTGVTVNLSTGTATAVAGGITSILNVVGSPYNDTLTGNNSNNTLTGDGGSDTFSAGGSGSHTFVLSFGQTSSTVVTGGTGGDTLEENNGNYNTWNLTGANSGNVNGISFTHIANLISTSGDRFCLAPGGTLSGNLNAGGGALDYSGYTSGVAVNLLTGVAPGLNTFSNVAIVIGTPYNDTLTGGNSNATLNGNGGSDTLSGGGTGNHTFILAQSQAATTTVTGSSGSNETIEDFISSQTNLVSITGANAGSVKGISFTHIANLVSESYDDFQIVPGGGLTGTISGPGLLDYSGYNTGVTVNLLTGTATALGGASAYLDIFGTPYNDTLTGGNVNDSIFGDGGTDSLNGGGSGNHSIYLNAGQTSSTVVTGGSGSDTLFENTGGSVSTWTVTGANAGNVNGISFNHIAGLWASNSADVFRMQSGASLSGSITGGGTLDYSGYNTGVTVNLKTGTATAVAGGISNIVNVVGTPYNDTLTGNNSNNTLTGDGGSDTLSAGGSGNHTFVLSNGQLSTSVVTGGTGTDTLQDANSNPNSNLTNTWNITGANSGKVNGIVFTNIANLAGTVTSVWNYFDLKANGSLTGTVSGYWDVLDYSADPITMSVTAGQQNSNGYSGTGTSIGGFSGIGTVVGSLSYSTTTNTCTLFGGSFDAVWRIEGVNHGVLFPQGLNTSYGLDFSNFDILHGGSGSNIFRMRQTTNSSDPVSITTAIVGGTGDNTIDYTYYNAPVQLTLSQPANTSATWFLGSGSGVNSFKNIQHLIGSTSTTNTLTGANLNTAWTLTGSNAGSMVAAGSSQNLGIDWQSFAYLVGGTASDEFVFQTAGAVTGGINAGTGAMNWLNYTGYGATVTVNLSSGSATHVANGATSAVSNIQGVLGSLNYGNTLTGNSQADVLVGGNATDYLYSGSGASILIGGGGQDYLYDTSAGKDILIGGNVGFGSSNLEVALAAILAEWSSSDSYLARIQKIATGVDANHLYKLDNTTVTDDHVADWLEGSTSTSALDWYFADSASGSDHTDNRNSSETVTYLS
jgi:hypothetical protein